MSLAHKASNKETYCDVKAQCLMTQKEQEEVLKRNAMKKQICCE